LLQDTKHHVHFEHNLCHYKMLCNLWNFEDLIKHAQANFVYLSSTKNRECALKNGQALDYFAKLVKKQVH
jgi:hypothetical protein